MQTGGYKVAQVEQAKKARNVTPVMSQVQDEPGVIILFTTTHANIEMNAQDTPSAGHLR